jgi:ubiquinone biosynthesis UbiH/UbiF/VisC/COQ6 family hydroxylase
LPLPGGYNSAMKASSPAPQSLSRAARFDVVIVGVGLVGASLALALSQRDPGLKLALVDAAPPAPESADWDSRIYALSPASVDFLKQTGAWQAIDPQRLSPVRAMRVFGDAAGARLDFSAYECAVSELAWIAESGRVQSALWRSLQSATNVSLHCPARCSRLIASDGTGDQAGGRTADNALELDTGVVLHADLLVAADGGNSWLRAAAGLKAEVLPYGQLGVVANFECSVAHEGIARQWFNERGVLAWLPLPGKRISMVWSTPEAYARELLAMAPDALSRRVARAGGQVLGELRLLGAAAAFPLARGIAPELVRPGLALVGDAAHTVHPLAGQGVNLGFADARALADILAGRENFRTCGDLPLLRRYQRARAEDILAMRWTTDALARLFGSRSGPLAWLRNAGLNLTAASPVLKALLVRRALG